MLFGYSTDKPAFTLNRFSRKDPDFEHQSMEDFGMMNHVLL